MEVKAHIINEANTLLQRIGPTSMTMDMVARNCGISKRTLYEKFPDKRTLIKECLETKHDMQNKMVKQIFEESENCFAALFNVYQYVRERMRETTMAYVADLRRLYPELFAKQREQECHFVEGLAQVLTRAQNEGHVMTDINTMIASFLFLSTMRNLNENETIADLGLNQIEVFDGAFLNFLRGIATDAGRDIIDTHVQQMKETKS